MATIGANRGEISVIVVIVVISGENGANEHETDSKERRRKERKKERKKIGRETEAKWSERRQRRRWRRRWRWTPFEGHCTHR